MATPELLQYIKTQLQAGQTRESIKTSLIAMSWAEADIESAFHAVSPNSTLINNSLLATPVSNKNRFIKPAIILIIGLVVVSAIVLAGIAFMRSRNVVYPTPFQLSPTTQVIAPTIAQNYDETIQYSNPEQGYGFEYIKSWKLDKTGALTVLASPDNSKKEICGATLEQFLACDIVVSTTPYSGITLAEGVTVSGLPPEKTHNEQVKEFAQQFVSESTLSAVSINNLEGYQLSTTNAEGSVLNIILQGSKNMILIQFANKKELLELNKGQKIVLESIVEK